MNPGPIILIVAAILGAAVIVVDASTLAKTPGILEGFLAVITLAVVFGLSRLLKALLR
jgi:hypothetical protein